MCEDGKPPMCMDYSKPTCSDGTPPRHPHGKGKGKGQAVGENGHGQAPPAMNQQPVGQDGHGIAPWASQGQGAGKGQQAVGQNGHGIAPWASQGQDSGKGQQAVGQKGQGMAPPSMNQQPVGQDGHGIAWGSKGEGKGKGQQAQGGAPWAGAQGDQQLVNGMPPSDMNGVPMDAQYQQQQPSWQSWYQDAISPASERVLSAANQAERPGKGFGRHPWWEQEEAEKGGVAPGGRHKFRHWDHWKKTHPGEVKVEFMCLK